MVFDGQPSIGVPSPEKYIFRQEAQLSQRDRAGGCVSFGQKWKNGSGRRYFADIVGLSATTVT